MSSVGYLNNCLLQNNIDICALSDHQLSLHNLAFLDTFNSEYKAVASPANESKNSKATRSGGTVILIHKRIQPFSQELEIDSDRITAVELSLPNLSPLYILSVYLPPSNRSQDLFKHCLTEMIETFSAFCQKGHVLILGDINARLTGPRYGGKLDARSTLVEDFISTHSLVSVNMQGFCTGPVCTFYAYEGGPQSPIDHIIIPMELLKSVRHAEVKEDNPLNISDHRPVICSLNMELPVCTSSTPSSPQSKPAWEKAATNGNLLDYTYAVSQNLWATPQLKPGCPDSDIEELYTVIVTSLKKAASDCLPMRKYRQYIKPYWNAAVKEHHKAMTDARHAWIAEGQPRGMEHPSFFIYKKKKDEFRTTMKEAALSHQNEHFSNLDQLYDVDQKAFWSLINKGNKKMQISSLCAGDKCTTDPVQISQLLADHMKQIFSNSREDHFDVQFKQELEGKVRQLKLHHSTTNIDADDLLTCQNELKKVCASLKNSKACGHDGLYYEHLKYGGDNLYAALSHLFNEILTSGHVPVQWKKGIITPIFKGGGKLKTSPDSYRGITLLPVISKVFEIILSRRLPQICESTSFPDPHQCGFQRGLSSLHASLILQETVHHYNERHDAAKVVLLDSAKAFDTVWHDGLLWKLHEMKIHPALWRIFCNTYTGMESCVMANNSQSSWFRLERGVRQGSVLSAKLYLVYVNTLLIKLSSLKKGALVLDLHIAAPTQADDICLISPVTSYLQSMVSLCEDYSSKWQFTFSPSKSNVMVFHPSKDIRCTVKLYNKPIPQVDSTKHVGILLNSRLNSWDRTLNAISKMKSTAMMLLKSGCHRDGLNPITSSNLIRSVCLPRALFGCELWSGLNKAEVIALERAQRFCLKMCQGLPKTTRTDICNSLLGWTSIESHIDTRKLFFFGVMCNGQGHFLSRQLFVSRLFSFKNNCSRVATGFIPDISPIMEKYNLTPHLDKFIKLGVFMKQASWKKIVKRAVREYEKSKWRDRLDLDPDLVHFKLVHPVIEPHPAWTIAKTYPDFKVKCHAIVQLSALWRPGSVQGRCVLCDVIFNDLLVHAVCSCQSRSDIRDRLWCDLIDVGPVDLSVMLHDKPDIEMVCCLLSCTPPVTLCDAEKELFSKAVIKGLYDICMS